MYWVCANLYREKNEIYETLVCLLKKMTVEEKNLKNDDGLCGS